MKGFGYDAGETEGGAGAVFVGVREGGCVGRELENERRRGGVGGGVGERVVKPYEAAHWRAEPEVDVVLTRRPKRG